MSFADILNERIGQAVAWLTAVMAVITFVVVVARYGFDQGSIFLQESVTYLHAISFMLGIAYTFKHDEHVRVDILYSRLSERGKAWANLTGHLLFLVPVALTLCYFSFDYAWASWIILEGSPEVGGIPATFVLKTLIPLMAVLLLLQGVAEIARAMATIRGSGGTADGG